MPKHHLYVMNPIAAAPAGDGDTKSWFLFYKFRVEGEVFVPKTAPLFKAEPGDYIWFAFEAQDPGGRRCARVFGGAQIVRVEEESRGRQEIWYRGDEVLDWPEDVLFDFDESTLEVPAKEAEEWLMRAGRNTP
jgi:hypothetical protein